VPAKTDSTHCQHLRPGRLSDAEHCADPPGCGGCLGQRRWRKRRCWSGCSRGWSAPEPGQPLGGERQNDRPVADLDTVRTTSDRVREQQRRVEPGDGIDIAGRWLEVIVGDSRRIRAARPPEVRRKRGSRDGGSDRRAAYAAVPYVRLSRTSPNALGSGRLRKSGSASVEVVDEVDLPRQGWAPAGRPARLGLSHLRSDAAARADARLVARATAMRACRTCAARATGKRFSECRSAWLSGSLGAEGATLLPLLKLASLGLADRDARCRGDAGVKARVAERQFRLSRPAPGSSNRLVLWSLITLAGFREKDDARDNRRLPRWPSHSLLGRRREQARTVGTVLVSTAVSPEADGSSGFDGVPCMCATADGCCLGRACRRSAPRRVGGGRRCRASSRRW
jgi:hypothetical protein